MNNQLQLICHLLYLFEYSHRNSTKLRTSHNNDCKRKTVNCLSKMMLHTACDATSPVILDFSILSKLLELGSKRPCPIYSWTLVGKHSWLVLLKVGVTALFFKANVVGEAVNSN
ncbi:hypothetical protein KIN20_020460 [Parelaphostrongylus tenuis]|uniref:Uncharacterized protein n=1 Tax=Parelaphostrongylus tenuis TaxID=148309 RepID=A0AAD5MRA2_PARTN|nr:hypothetical protein KIN20_020460 [Parelaphostrongylus tenuis]